MKISNLKLKIEKCLSFLPYVFVFIASLYQPKDPDLGWHLKYGEYFFKHHQLLRDNIFSTMMPNYHWANGSWGTDLITYAIFHFSGFLGLTIAAALVVTLTFFFFSKAAKFTFFENALIFPVLIFLESSMNSNSLRGQQLTLLFLGILFFILSRYKQFSKKLFIVPVLFFVWCNVHEESFLGLALFGLWTLSIVIKSFTMYFAKKRTAFYKNCLFLSIVLLMTFLATFINPYGADIHLTALSHISNPLLQQVNEYIPFPMFSVPWFNLIGITILMLLAVTYLFFKKRFVAFLPIFGIPLILLLFSFSVRRYAWPAYYLIFPFLGIFTSEIKLNLRKYSIILGLIISSISILCIIYLKMPLTQFSDMSWKAYCQIQATPCSSQSAEYLINHNLTKDLYSYYDWGGWLIWNYSEIKPSIDGRMHVWRDNNGYSASAEYYAYENVQKNIDDSKYDIIYRPLDRSPIYFELSNLVSQNKWKLVYEDAYAGIIVRVKNKF